MLVASSRPAENGRFKPYWLQPRLDQLPCSLYPTDVSGGGAWRSAGGLQDYDLLVLLVFARSELGLPHANVARRTIEPQTVQIFQCLYYFCWPDSWARDNSRGKSKCASSTSCLRPISASLRQLGWRQIYNQVLGQDSPSVSLCCADVIGQVGPLDTTGQCSRIPAWQEKIRFTMSSRYHYRIRAKNDVRSTIGI